MALYEVEIMEPQLSSEELRGLQSLDTDEAIKPVLPTAVADRLIELGLAIQLVEGGLQLTTLGREKLSLNSKRG